MMWRHHILLNKCESYKKQARFHFMASWHTKIMTAESTVERDESVADPLVYLWFIFRFFLYEIWRYFCKKV